LFVWEFHKGARKPMAPHLTSEIVQQYADKYRALAATRPKVQFIDPVPVVQHSKRCLARLMNGKPCPYAPLKCSKYCKKHS
jgi:hypothetical protein